MTEWVNVDDRLPPIDEAVLIYTILHTIEIAAINPPQYRGTFWFYPDNNGWDEEEVTHWMALPEPPKEVDE